MKYFDIRTIFLLYKNSLRYYPKIENKLKQQSVKYLAHVYKTTPCITLNIVSFIEPEYLIYLFKYNTIQFYQSILFNDIKRLNNVFKQTIDHELTNKYLDIFKEIPYVFNLGHGLLPSTDPKKVGKLIEFYREY